MHLWMWLAYYRFIFSFFLLIREREVDEGFIRVNPRTLKIFQFLRLRGHVIQLTHLTMFITDIKSLLCLSSLNRPCLHHCIDHLGYL